MNNKTPTSILITGGAGYIGSHTCRILSKKGLNLVVLDNLEYGHRDALEVSENLHFYQGSVGNESLLKKIFINHKIEAVVHFAAYTYVGESVAQPEKYYENNILQPMTLLRVMKSFGCVNIIFSSTCATYGNPHYLPLDENHPQHPVSPYGKSKYFLEQIIRDYSKAYGFRYVFLRYFNASGAAMDGSIGEDHDPETHLIPLLLKTAKGESGPLKIFGNDYETPDGTCLRDYIHVEDLAEAHFLALSYLQQRKASNAFNLGTGKGYSVMEVIHEVENVTNRKVPFEIVPRREGDATSLVAQASLAKSQLGWEAKHKSLYSIVESAWKWENGPSNGKYNN
ncbi:UDP-glucose 4-epimerase GalE [Litoribacter alkaliphilus]|uniref:UDP-glucose 4-epimerase n=1 Tax=Litoribacter ruber TaxID=702568 RepID=A0AAP2CL59_9BACT|nr:UDP-glucose 4-epimerase GalE [Litoribacter alkaliphilus]MBS9525734.1 UDP-glucose 4-epimerase GalE [Litoribacter alkaliphilus]